MSLQLATLKPAAPSRQTKDFRLRRPNSLNAPTPFAAGATANKLTSYGHFLLRLKEQKHKLRFVESFGSFLSSPSKYGTRQCQNPRTHFGVMLKGVQPILQPLTISFQRSNFGSSERLLNRQTWIQLLGSAPQRVTLRHHRRFLVCFQTLMNDQVSDSFNLETATVGGNPKGTPGSETPKSKA